MSGDGEGGRIAMTKEIEDVEGAENAEVATTSAPGQYEEEAEEVAQPEKSRFWPPSRDNLLNWAPFWGVILLGAILRFWGLGDKPLHHDESLHAYYSLILLHNNLQHWMSCFNPAVYCYRYDPMLHGPFQFHAIALVYQICQWLGVSDHGVNTFTVRIPAAVLGTVIIGLPYFIRDYLGKIGAWIASFLLAVSPSMVYFSRFAREDIYMACFTLLMVVAVARYVRDRKMRWIVLCAVAFSLSYATNEATFLTIAVFGSFLVALVVWEIGVRWPLRSRVDADVPYKKYLPRTWAPVLLVALAVIAAPLAKGFFSFLQALSIYITDPRHTQAADAFMSRLKGATVPVILWIGILLCVYVLVVLVLEILEKLPQTRRSSLALRIDPERQPLLDTILNIPLTYWFFSLFCGWFIFLVLFTALFTNVSGGIGDGIWQGLYYWLQQQEVARGNQPWYYYFLLIPLYEQIGVVFGLVGLVRCLLRPTRFRLFLVWWFVGDVAIYSWAAEKMPWLMIFMTMPMMLLAAIGLEPVVVTLINLIKGWQTAHAPAQAEASIQGDGGATLPAPPCPRVGKVAGGVAIFSAVLALLLLAPTLHNMYEVSYVHAADGPHEMMVYVQTTTDVNIVMDKVNSVDKKLDGGRHQISIGVMDDATWPFAWYLRDYPNVYYQNGSNHCKLPNENFTVIIAGGDCLAAAEMTYQQTYAYHQYHMRTWWDEGYKPPPCVPSKANNCADQPAWGGVGPWLWLSYGDNPPPGAKFDLGRAVNNVWQWWWQRKAIGSTTGSYDMMLLIPKNVGVAP
jgi:uncharacterized protein (TIGR03663 family)